MLARLVKEDIQTGFHASGPTKLHETDANIWVDIKSLKTTERETCVAVSKTPYILEGLMHLGSLGSENRAQTLGSG